MFRKTLVVATLAGGLMLAAPTAAFADSYLDEAIQALQSSNVYVSTQVSEIDASQEASLVSQIGTTDIAIVVLPANAKSEITDIPAFLSEIASATNHDTILVSIGGDFEAGSSALPAGTASQLANNAEEGDLYSGLSEFVQAVTQSSQETPDTPSDSGGADLGPTFGILGAIVGLTLVSATAYMFIRARLRRSKPFDKHHAPDVLHDNMRSINELADSIRDSSVAQNLREAENHIRELFKRLRKQVPDQIQQITAQYRITLETVRKVVERYVDIEQNELYYKRPEELLESGRHAIEQYRNGVIQNIREIEEGALTDFRVDAKILESTVKKEEPDYLAIPIETKHDKQKRK